MRPLLVFASILVLGSAVALAEPPADKASGAAPVKDAASDPGKDTKDANPKGAALPAFANAPAARKSVDMADIRVFTAVFSLIKQAYVEEIDDRSLMRGAIRGMLAGLDPHSEYLDKEELSGLTEETTGSYAGLGLEVAQVEGTLRVVTPIDDTPAQRGGIRAGDIILRIDGKAVQSDDLDGAIARLRGKPGTSVTLSVLHEKQTTPVDITLTREAIHVASARGRLLEPGFGYLRVSQFQEETAMQLRKQFERLQAANKAPLRGVVLDLRSNPGGLVAAAVEIADDFLDRGVIVSTRGRVKQADTSFSATPGDLLTGAPLVVLVDNGSASAAEIVAGALKDNHRALLMGRRTFGKGSVQTVLPIDGEHAVKLTTARYYTPSGTSIQAAGIRPDIELADLSLSARNDDFDSGLGERDLRNHLKGVNEGAADRAAITQHEVPSDYALNEALNALKVLALRATPAAPPAPAKS